MTSVTPPMSSIASYLAGADSSLSVKMRLGRQIVQRFMSLQQELQAIFSSAAVFDLGYRRLMAVRGSDQVRWLNGMITNTVKDLAESRTNYSFVLNAQGKIQGDLTAYRFGDHLWLETDEAQAETLYAHLDHYIIMDDVELEMLQGWTALGMAGPEAAAVLERAGLPAPGEADSFAEIEIEGERAVVAHAASAGTPRFVLWMRESAAPAQWEKLRAAGAAAVGAEAAEALRVLEGVPQYGVDFGDKQLPQEVDAVRPLNFNKGCYLGQEIVERIRSRATVHRGLRRMELSGSLPAGATPVLAEGQAIGEITSAAAIEMPEGQRIFGLGILRNEPVERKQELTYEGGSARVLEGAAAADLREALKNQAMS